jgi:hypothetical protein
MNRSIFAVLLCMSMCLVAYSQQQREPDTPSIQDTVSYINSNLDADVSLSGTTLTIKGRVWETSADVMDLSFAGPDNDSGRVFIGCIGNKKCISWSYIGNGNDRDHDDSTYVTWEAVNASIVPHVANAFGHLIRLIHQQEIGRQPF